MWMSTPGGIPELVGVDAYREAGPGVDGKHEEEREPQLHPVAPDVDPELFCAGEVLEADGDAQAQRGQRVVLLVAPEGDQHRDDGTRLHDAERDVY